MKSLITAKTCSLGHRWNEINIFSVTAAAQCEESAVKTKGN